MAYFTPNGIIKIGRVPFDNSYAHTMTFDSKEFQANYFSSVCKQALERNTYTYVRMNNSIRVAENAEKLYTYNYCMYKNENYGNKWFYAFIVGCNYVNENCTELLLELDVMQTWYFDYDLVEGFVEREHVLDDSYGNHINPEPEMPLEWLIQTRDIYSLNDAKFVVATSELLTADGTVAISYPVTNIGGLPSGLYYFIFNLDEINTVLTDFLNTYRNAGIDDSIQATFIYPSQLLGVYQHPQAQSIYMGTRLRGPSSSSETAPMAVTIPNHLGSENEKYIPHNNKLLTYPYTYCRISDNATGYYDYRFEYFNTHKISGDVGFNIRGSISVNPVLMVVPYAYNNVSNSNANESFTTQYNIPWSYNSRQFEAWVAQNGIANALNVASSIVPLAMPLKTGLSSGIRAIGETHKVRRNKKGQVASVKKEVQFGSFPDEVRIREANRYADAVNGAIQNSMNGAIGVIGDVSRMAMKPSYTKGVADGNILYSSNFADINFDTVSLRKEFAVIVDRFLDMYGYQTDLVKIPNITGRPYWNYVKMLNACHRGRVPADDMAQINSIYNAGITFWHTDQIGNYELNNSANGISDEEWSSYSINE